MDGLLPPTWLEVTGCEGKSRADLVEGIYTVRAKPLGKKPSYQKVADYETPVVLWYNSQRSSWTISVFPNANAARKARNILAMVNDSTELPHRISHVWHVVDHDSSSVLACSQLKVTKTDPILIRVSGRRGANTHRINGTFVQREEILGGKYSFKRQTDDGEEIILWYYKRKKCWMISWKGHVETENAYAVCKGEGDLPSDLDGGTWFVWISKKQSFAEDNSIRVKLGGIRMQIESLNLAADSSSSSPQHTSPASVTYDDLTKPNLNENSIRFPPPVTEDMLAHIGSNSPQVFIPPPTRNWTDDANTLCFDLLQNNDSRPSLSDSDNDSLSRGSEHEYEQATLFASMKDLTLNEPVSPTKGMERRARNNISNLRRRSVEIRMQSGFDGFVPKVAADSVWSTEYLASAEGHQQEVPTKALLDDSSDWA